MNGASNTAIAHFSPMTTAPKRRLFRFSLRTMFVVVTLVGVACGIGWTINQAVQRVGDRDRMLSLLRLRGALAGKAVSDAPAKGVPFLWAMFGAHPVGVLVLPDEGFTNAEQAEIAFLFPEAEIKQHTWRMDRGPSRPQDRR